MVNVGKYTSPMDLMGWWDSDGTEMDVVMIKSGVLFGALS